MRLTLKETTKKAMQSICIGIALLMGVGGFIEANASQYQDLKECKDACKEGLAHCQATCREHFGTYYHKYPDCINSCKSGSSSCKNKCKIDFRLN